MKILYKLGTLASITAPVAVAVSCGQKNNSQTGAVRTMKDGYTIKSVSDMNNLFADANYLPQNKNAAEVLLKSLLPSGNWNFTGKTFKSTDKAKTKDFAVVLSGPAQVAIAKLEATTYPYTDQMPDDPNGDNSITNNIEKLFGIKESDIHSAYAIIFFKASISKTPSITYSSINSMGDKIYLNQTPAMNASIVGQDQDATDNAKPVQLPSATEQAKKDLADIKDAQIKLDMAQSEYDVAQQNGGDKTGNLAIALSDAKAALEELNKGASKHLSDIFYKNISAAERTKFPQGTRGFVINGADKNLVFFEPFQGALGFNEIKTIEHSKDLSKPDQAQPIKAFFYANTTIQKTQGDNPTQTSFNYTYYSIKEHYKRFAWISKENSFEIDKHYQGAFDYIKTFYEFDKFTTTDLPAIIASLGKTEY